MVSRFTRSYQDAIHELNKSIKRLNYLPSSNPKLLREQSCGLSAVYCSAVGIHDQQLRDLHVIHVTGSKGKGSVCSMIESILRKSGFHTGFLSSPHLINVEERIRIDGQPISRDHFADVFWDVHGKLLEFTKISTNTTMPSFLHYIFVMACKAFVEMKVDVGIFEVGIGGRYDHTNIFKDPYVTIITSLALEHTNILGDTIGEIAWRKAGIFKPGSIAVVSHGQPYEATLKFIEEAEHVGCPLYVAPPLNLLLTKDNMTESIKKIIDNVNTLPKCQLLNLALSLTAVNFWFAKLYGTDDDNIQKIGLQPTFVWQPSSTVINDALSARWPGRWQIVIRRNITYFLDGAHTIESLQSAVKWFHDKSFSLQNNKRTMRIVIFTVTGPRDPKPFLECLQLSSSVFDFVVFANPHDNQFGNSALKSFPNKCTNNSDGADTMLYCHIFVTGSLYMVGRILKEIDEPV
ncbi:Folylpolyglutamate synthase, mitochondrial [Schistosoma japonicum]|nr:Folylpolyglutamate synthase, mitochondrial [Schistosoma japonicum]